MRWRRSSRASLPMTPTLSLGPLVRGSSSNLFSPLLSAHPALSTQPRIHLLLLLASVDDSYGDEIAVTVVATSFEVPDAASARSEPDKARPPPPPSYSEWQQAQQKEAPKKKKKRRGFFGLF